MFYRLPQVTEITERRAKVASGLWTIFLPEWFLVRAHPKTSDGLLRGFRGGDAEKGRFRTGTRWTGRLARGRPGR